MQTEPLVTESRGKCSVLHSRLPPGRLLIDHKRPSWEHLVESWQMGSVDSGFSAKRSVDWWCQRGKLKLEAMEMSEKEMAEHQSN